MRPIDPGFDLEFRPEPSVIRTARDATEVLASHVSQEIVDNVRLLVSELVTNSVKHGRLGPDQWVRLKLKFDDTTIRVEVVDPGKGFEIPEPATGEAESGWGMYLLERLSDRWGVDSADDTCVWFEVDTLDPGPRAR